MMDSHRGVVSFAWAILGRGRFGSHHDFFLGRMDMRAFLPSADPIGSFAHRDCSMVCGRDIRSPLASVITTCKGRLHHLKQSLPSMLAQRCSFEFEVIVVDYGCPQKTFEWCRSLDVAKLVAIRVLGDTSEFNRSRSRNCGASVARGKFMAFIDADIVPDQDWLEIATQSMRSGRSGFCTVADSFRNGWDRGGTYLIAADLFHQIRGYDEAIRGWGAEDADVYGRVGSLAKASRYAACHVDIIRHSDAERVQFHEEKAIGASCGRNQAYIARRGGCVNPLGYGQGPYEVFRGSSQKLPPLAWLRRNRITRPIRRPQLA